MSLIGLLEALDYSRVDVDLFVYRHTGELMGMIPPQVHLLPEIPEYAQIERPMKKVIRDGYLRIALARLTARVKNRRFERRRHPRENGSVFSFVSRQVVTCLPEINPGKEYDLAVSFLTPHDFVLKKVRAGKKAAWIHKALFPFGISFVGGQGRGDSKPLTRRPDCDSLRFDIGYGSRKRDAKGIR